MYCVFENLIVCCFTKHSAFSLNAMYKLVTDLYKLQIFVYLCDALWRKPFAVLLDDVRHKLHSLYSACVSCCRAQMMVKSTATSHFSWLWSLTPFSEAVWQAVLTFLILISVILYLSLWTVNKLFPQGKQANPDFFGNFIYIYGFFCYQGYYT